MVGARHVLADADLRAGYERDWTGRFVGSTPCVVRPASAVEVADVLGVCVRHGVAVVPQGGNTGLVGGSVPLGREVVVSLRRIDAIGEADRLARQVTVGAGATLGAVQDSLDGSGLALGVDLAARDSATIGGMVATNAGGIHVVRHGSMRSQVVGVEAVLGDGRIIEHLAGLEKDNTGYDLAALLCGSEGTLGIITRVRLRLVNPPAERTLAMIGCASSAAAVETAAAARSVAGINAIEAVWAPTAQVVADHLDTDPPIDAAVLVLVEVGGDDDPTTPLAEALESLPGVVDDALVATGPAGQLNLWRFREAATESLAAAGVDVKLDVTLPAGELAGFADDVGPLVSSVDPGAATYLFGHLGDGNLHVNVRSLSAPLTEIEDRVLTEVAARGGSISAEHGIGTAKRAWLGLMRSDDELSAFRSLRDAFDPNGVLNPQVLLPR